MRKLTVPIMGVLLLIASCSKESKQIQQQETIVQESEGRKCAADEVLQRQIAADPARKAFLDQLEERTRNFIPAEGRASGKLYIPVIIHVVTANPSQVTDAQIQTQMDALNRDYQHKNSELVTGVYLAGYNYNSV